MHASAWKQFLQFSNWTFLALVQRNKKKTNKQEGIQNVAKMLILVQLSWFVLFISFPVGRLVKYICELLIQFIHIWSLSSSFFLFISRDTQRRRIYKPSLCTLCYARTLLIHRMRLSEKCQNEFGIERKEKEKMLSFGFVHVIRLVWRHEMPFSESNSFFSFQLQTFSNNYLCAFATINGMTNLIKCL